MDERQKEQVVDAYQAFVSKGQSKDDILNTVAVNGVDKAFKNIFSAMAVKGRTSKLWLQYLRQVELVRMFVRAERSDDWKLHLHCVKEMLPYFHAAAHLSYDKSAHLYLQQMLNLPNKMEQQVYTQYTEKGFFSIRRTNKFWSGLWTDLTIEQVLMRSMKTSGGLTRGRDLSDSSIYIEMG